MAKVSYHPEAGASDETEQFGYSFADGSPTEVRDEDTKALAKFEGNPFFTVEGGTESKSKLPAEGLKAVHNGGGRFVIKDGDTIVKEGLNKSDASAFNAMSDEDKAEYVAD